MEKKLILLAILLFPIINFSQTSLDDGTTTAYWGNLGELDSILDLIQLLFFESLAPNLTAQPMLNLRAGPPMGDMEKIPIVYSIIINIK